MGHTHLSDNTWIPWKGLKLDICIIVINIIQIRRQHLNSLKGIETPVWLSNASSSSPDNTWIPWKGLKLLSKENPAIPLRYRQHLNSLKGIETPVSKENCTIKLTDNTWIPWKGLKQTDHCPAWGVYGNGRQHLNSLKGIETSEKVDLPKIIRDRQHLNSLKGIETCISCFPCWQRIFRQHLNSLKGIETLKGECIETSEGSRSDNTWIPWKGLKLLLGTLIVNLHDCPTTLEFPERDWNIADIL